MKEWPKTPDEIAYELQGTCRSLNDILEQYEMEGAEDDSDFCSALDDKVFECAICGWWFEQCEMAVDDPQDRWVCQECADDSE